MDIIITNSSERPIYEQIEEQIKAMIVKGQLKEGEALPSMRLLAKELRISVITTKRAYEELEKEGFIETVGGKGSFVSGCNFQLIKEEQLKKIESNLQEAVSAAKNVDINLQELIEIITLIYEEDI